MLLPTLLSTSDGPGYFVELGALDGVHYSNTLMLERCWRWDGLLIEANPNSYQNMLRMGRRFGRRARMRHARANWCKSIKA